MTSLGKIRTDVIGSLLRPAALKTARAQFDEGEISADELRAAEDEAVKSAIGLQENAGLDIVTDGEARRLNFQDSFGASVEGYDAKRSSLHAHEVRVAGATPHQQWVVPKTQESGAAVSNRRPAKERLRLGRNIPLEEYIFASAQAKGPVKVSLIGPDRIMQRFDLAASKAVYADMDAFAADVVAIERQIIKSLIEVGARYIHIDAPGFTAYVDPALLTQMKERGEDPMENFSRSLKAEAALVQGFPDVTFGIHLCRGNQRSMWHREGAYDAIAERIFNELPHHRFMLEYDTPRAGSFEPLRFVPKGKVVVLGLVSSKVAQLEDVDFLKRRIDEATKFIPLEQLAISPQCGFASDVVGNLLSEDDQKRKLERVVEVARQIWH
jgi:5-methyltetrahydropteroyltriglutamate--homocysteine methyltransferase